IPRSTSTTAIAAATKPCMITDMSLSGLAMVISLTLLRLRRGLWRCAHRFGLRSGGIDLRIELEGESLDALAFVFFGIFHLDFVEVAGALHGGDEIGDGIYGSRRTGDGEGVALFGHIGQPKVFRAGYGVGYHVQEFLAA